MSSSDSDSSPASSASSSSSSSASAASGETSDSSDSSAASSAASASGSSVKLHDLLAALQAGHFTSTSISVTSLPPSAAQRADFVTKHKAVVEEVLQLFNENNLVLGSDTSQWDKIAIFRWARPGALHASAIPLIVKRAGKWSLAMATDDLASCTAACFLAKGIVKTGDTSVQWYELDLAKPRPQDRTRYAAFLDPKPLPSPKKTQKKSPAEQSAPADSAPDGTVGPHKCNWVHGTVCDRPGKCPIGECDVCFIKAPDGKRLPGGVSSGCVCSKADGKAKVAVRPPPQGSVRSAAAAAASAAASALASATAIAEANAAAAAAAPAPPPPAPSFRSGIAAGSHRAGRPAAAAASPRPSRSRSPRSPSAAAATAGAGCSSPASAAGAAAPRRPVLDRSRTARGAAARDSMSSRSVRSVRSTSPPVATGGSAHMRAAVAAGYASAASAAAGTSAYGRIGTCAGTGSGGSFGAGIGAATAAAASGAAGRGAATAASASGDAAVVACRRPFASVKLSVIHPDLLTTADLLSGPVGTAPPTGVVDVPSPSPSPTGRRARLRRRTGASPRRSPSPSSPSSSPSRGSADDGADGAAGGAPGVRQRKDGGYSRRWEDMPPTRPLASTVHPLPTDYSHPGPRTFHVKQSAIAKVSSGIDTSRSHPLLEPEDRTAPDTCTTYSRQITKAECASLGDTIRKEVINKAWPELEGDLWLDWEGVIVVYVNTGESVSFICTRRSDHCRWRVGSIVFPLTTRGKGTPFVRWTTSPLGFVDTTTDPVYEMTKPHCWINCFGAAPRRGDDDLAAHTVGLRASGPSDMGGDVYAAALHIYVSRRLCEVGKFGVPALPIPGRTAGIRDVLYVSDRKVSICEELFGESSTDAKTGKTVVTYPKVCEPEPEQYKDALDWLFTHARYFAADRVWVQFDVPSGTRRVVKGAFLRQRTSKGARGHWTTSLLPKSLPGDVVVTLRGLSDTDSTLGRVTIVDRRKDAPPPAPPPGGAAAAPRRTRALPPVPPPVASGATRKRARSASPAGTSGSDSDDDASARAAVAAAEASAAAARAAEATAVATATQARADATEASVRAAAATARADEATRKADMATSAAATVGATAAAATAASEQKDEQIKTLKEQIQSLKEQNRALEVRLERADTALENERNARAASDKECAVHRAKSAALNGQLTAIVPILVDQMKEVKASRKEAREDRQQAATQYEALSVRSSQVGLMHVQTVAAAVAAAAGKDVSLSTPTPAALATAGSLAHAAIPSTPAPVLAPPGSGGTGGASSSASAAFAAPKGGVGSASVASPPSALAATGVVPSPAPTHSALSGIGGTGGMGGVASASAAASKPTSADSKAEIMSSLMTLGRLVTEDSDDD